jgi:hypothetical protein
MQIVTCANGEEIALWSASDALVLKLLTLTFKRSYPYIAVVPTSRGTVATREPYVKLITGWQAVRIPLFVKLIFAVIMPILTNINYWSNSPPISNVPLY